MLFILLWTLTVRFTWQSMGQSQASRFSSKISNCVLKTNEAFTGSERHGVSEKQQFSFWGGVSL